MKKLLFIFLIIIIAVTATACFPFRITIEYEPPEVAEPITVTEPTEITEPTVDTRYVEYNGNTICLRTVTAPEGYCFYHKNGGGRMGEVLYLGCNDEWQNYDLLLDEPQNEEE